MILAVDAGNSNIVLGCMEGLTVRRTLRLATDRAMDAAGYTAALRALLARNGYYSTDFRGAILSSVVAAVTEPLRQALSALTAAPVPVVGDTVKSAIPLRIDRPETIGADLIAAAEGALAQYAPPLILVDMGTATTFSVLDETGAFLGGRHRTWRAPGGGSPRPADGTAHGNDDCAPKLSEPQHGRLSAQRHRAGRRRHGGRYAGPAGGGAGHVGDRRGHRRAGRVRDPPLPPSGHP